MNTKYNIYYSITPEGPWILANNIPIDRDPNGNTYTISGLQSNIIYYISVVGGYIEDDEFIPLISQPIRQSSNLSHGAEFKPDSYIATKTYLPAKFDTTNISHQFEVNEVNTHDSLSHQFSSSIKIDGTLSHEFLVAIDTEDVFGTQFKVGSINVESGLSHQFYSSIHTSSGLSQEYYVGSIHVEDPFSHEFEIGSLWVTFSGSETVEEFTSSSPSYFYEDEWDRNTVSSFNDVEWTIAVISGVDTVEQFGW